jgi:arylsulfatase B
MLKNGFSAPRYEIPNIDNIFGFGSLIYKNYKFVNGTLQNGKLDGWLSERNTRPFDNNVSYLLKVLSSTTHQAMLKNPHWNLQYNLLRLRKMRNNAKVNCSIRRKKFPCDLTKAPCLFNIFEDPCEENNIAEFLPQRFEEIKKLYLDKLNEVVPSLRVKEDPACNPLYFNNTWTWWQGEL